MPISQTMEKMNPKRPLRKTIEIVLLLGSLMFCIYGLTTSYHAFGYEGLNIGEVEMWVFGEKPLTGRSGLIEVAAYAIPALVKRMLNEMDTPFRLDWIAYVFIQPFIATLICLAFFGFCLDLYGRLRPAIASTVILALCTMIWPYSKFGMENHLTLWVLLASWSLHRYCRAGRWLSAAAFGLSIACILLTKMIGILFSVAFFLCFIWLVLTRKHYQRQEFGIHFSLVLVLWLWGLVIFAISNSIRYGGWVLGNRYDPTSEIHLMPILPSLAAAIVSPGKSLFLFSPPLLISLFYLNRFMKRFPELRVVLASVLAISVWQIISLRYFYDETWGPRRLLYLIPLACLPLGIWIESFARLSIPRKTLSIAVIVAGVFVQSLAVGFAYSAHAFVLAKRSLYSIENTVWLPELSHLKFNLHLYKSMYSRLRGNESIDFVFAQNYCPGLARRYRHRKGDSMCPTMTRSTFGLFSSRSFGRKPANIPAPVFTSRSFCSCSWRSRWCA